MIFFNALNNILLIFPINGIVHSMNEVYYNTYSWNSGYNWLEIIS